MATYNDYPESASNNAKKVLAWKKKYGSEVKGMTSVGWTRANQLASKEKLSYKTIARMAAFKRHQKNATIDPKYKSTPWKDRGYVAWLGWGGTSGVNWAIKKAESLRNSMSEQEFDAMNELPLFNITLDDFVEGMYKISLVDKPAIEENFLYFSEQEAPKLEFANSEKKEVVGPIMIPNKPILRHSPEKGYYNVQFTEEIIQEIMYKYSKDGLWNSFGIHHSYDTHDVTMLEVWMKESDNDKSKDYGYDLPNGTVFVKTKIESDELFNAIKDGEVNGFSIEIEANIELTNTEEEMNEFSFGMELGKMITRIEALEAQNAEFAAQLENFNAPTEEVVETMEEVSIELNEEEAIEEVAEEAAEEVVAEEAQEEVAEVVEEELSVVDETVVEETVEEEFSAEEEVNEEKVEEEFAALQNEEEVAEEPNTVLEFNGITPEKVNLVNDFFARFK